MSQEQPSLSLAGKLAHRKALHASAQNGLSTTDRSFLCRVQSREKGGEEEPEAEPQGQEGGREKALPPTARKPRPGAKRRRRKGVPPLPICSAPVRLKHQEVTLCFGRWFII